MACVSAPLEGARLRQPCGGEPKSLNRVPLNSYNMDRKRVVYAPVELPYRASPLEEMLEAAVAVVGRQLTPPQVELAAVGCFGTPPEITVSRVCPPGLGLAPEYRKWVKVPPLPHRSGYGSHGQQYQPAGKLAMPFTDIEIQRILTSSDLLDHECVCFRRGTEGGTSIANYATADSSGGLMNDYYSYPDEYLLEMIGKAVGDAYPEFAEVARNCRRRPGQRIQDVRLSDHAARVLMEAATVYAFSRYDEADSGGYSSG